MVIVTMGVSGAGKSTLGRGLAERLGFRFEEGDEWHAPASVEKMRRGEPLSEDDRGPWLARLNRSVREWIAAKQDVVLACSALRRSHRQALRSGCDPGQLRFVFLDGTYEQVEPQLHARTGHFMPAALLGNLQQDRHLIHHLYPSVPWYRYRAVFRELRPLLEAQGATIEGLDADPPRPIQWRAHAEPS